MSRIKFIFLVVVTIIIALTACDEEFQPLPVGQIRITLPPHEYKAIETFCPYSIEAPNYAQIKSRKAPEKSCWSDLELTELKAVIHMTYRELQGDLARTLSETNDLTYSHVAMADNISDMTVSYPEHDVHGTVFTVEGNAASNIQFYVTDSSEHFLRGALYFNATPNKDSLAPVVTHVHEDIMHLIGSVRWRD